MSFKFDFSNLDLEDDEENVIRTDVPSFVTGQVGRVASEYEIDKSDALELSLDALTQALPSAFSYSPLVVPLSDDGIVPNSRRVKDDAAEAEKQKNIVTLLRRDLFDARYQLISEEDMTSTVDPSSSGRLEASSAVDYSKGNSFGEKALEYIDNPSDLVHGLYEGGLKTWECSLDLVDCLASLGSTSDGHEDWVRGKRIIEIGCGTAVPSLYLLHKLFSSPTTSGPNTEKRETEIILQDYNDLVLRLVTFPNVLLAWYASPLADRYRSEDEEPFDPAASGDLHVSSELLSGFRTSLEEQRISIRFIVGSWQSLSKMDTLFRAPLDLVLTSETIYEKCSLLSLIKLLKLASQGNTEGLRKDDVSTMTRNFAHDEYDRLCLVAAKVLYFGVGGGIMDFEQAVSQSGGKITTVLEKKAGVGRKVMSVEWP